jgi:hypothetical protein
MMPMQTQSIHPPPYTGRQTVARITMQYFTNGLDGLIRVDTNAPRCVGC